VRWNRAQGSRLESFWSGEQITVWLTFFATTPATPAATAVPAGTIMDPTAYLASISSRASVAGLSATSAAGRTYEMPPVLPLLAATTVCVLAGLAIVL
jgi:hypothetical protein